MVAYCDEAAGVVGADATEGFVADFDAQTSLLLLLEDVPDVEDAVAACGKKYRQSEISRVGFRDKKLVFLPCGTPSPVCEQSFVEARPHDGALFTVFGPNSRRPVSNGEEIF